MDTESIHVNRLLIAKGLRAFGDGYVSLLLPLYLLQLGFSPLEVGVIATTTLIGSGLLTLAVAHHAREHGMLQRQEHADIPARWIERTHQRDEQQRPELG